MKLAVTGSRHWTDEAKIIATLDDIRPRPTLLIHGGAEGVDAISAQWARANGIHRACVRPGNPKVASSYLDRNSVIVELADKVIAFRAAGKSNGTDDTIRKSTDCGKLLMVVES